MRDKLFHVACFLCTGLLVSPSIFGEEPTQPELLEIVKEGHQRGLWKPNLNVQDNSSFEKDGTDKKDPVANAFTKIYFFWNQIAKSILNTYKPEQIMLLPQQYLNQVEKILLQKGGKRQLGTEMFSKNPVPEKLKKEVELFFEKCCQCKLLTKDEIPNLEALLAFFREKLSSFVDKKDSDFIKTVDTFGNALLEFGNIVQKIRLAFEEKSERDYAPKEFPQLMEEFKGKKEALLQFVAQPHLCREQTAFDYNGDIGNFLKRIEALEWMQKFNAVRRTAAFKSFKPMDFKAKEEKAKNNFDIFGLDTDKVNYRNPFKQNQREKVGEFLKKAVEVFTEEIRNAYERIGRTAEENFINALKSLYKLTENAWTCERFDPKSVMQPFEEALLKCDIDMLINENKPKSDELQKSFKWLNEKTSIDTSAVEKDIYDTYIARFEDDVKKRFYAEVSALLELTNHRISFIKTIREIEETKHEDPDAAKRDAEKQTTEWRLKQEEYVKEFQAADVDFYNAFFGLKQKDEHEKYIPTAIGFVKQPKCLEVLEWRLKYYDLWDPTLGEKKEAPKEPNVKEQNAIIEKREKPETIKNENIPQEYTQLTNEKIILQGYTRLTNEKKSPK